MFRTVWLVLFTMLLAVCGGAQAATVQFKGGSVSNCLLSGTTYYCTTAFIGANDTASIASGYTVIVYGAIQLAYGQGLKMTGTARLETSGSYNIDLSQSAGLDISGGTIDAGGNFKLGASAQTITANVIATTVTTEGSSVTINGSVTATGAINLGSSATITGAVKGASITTANNTTIGGGLTVTGLADLGSSLKLTGGLSAGSVKTNSPADISGGIVSTGAIALGSYATVTGNVSGTVITSNSPVKITGTITGTSSITLASGSTIVGDITAPTVKLDSAGSTVKGNIKASTSLDIGSGSTVNGNLSGSTLVFQPSGTVINGNVTMSKDVDIGSGTTINGDLAARDVITRASGDNINGNAAVNSIYLDWGSTVAKVITCTGAGASGCSCVTKADPNYKPTCGGATTAPHHFQITHGGYGLTCQAQPVTVTACANATCTAPHFSGSINATLQPGGTVFTVTGGTNNAASVRQSTAGTVTISATGATNASTCVNTSTNSASCDMVFSDNGVILSVPDHVSMTTAAVTVQALKSASAPNAGKSCVPLVAGTTASVSFKCSYLDPTSGRAVGVMLKDKNAGAYSSVTCGPTGTGVPLAFDSNGTASASLQYAEVGSVGLTASYTASGLGASTPGVTSFTVAPKDFLVTPTPIGRDKPLLDGGGFERAGVPFTLKVQARNAAGDTVQNFGKESTKENIALDVRVTSPANGVGALLGTMGTIKDGVSSSDLYFTETGIIEVTARHVRSSRNYMDNPTTGFATQGKLTFPGPFVPHHYDTVLMTNEEITAAMPADYRDGRTMSCANLSVAARPCPTDTGRFIHSQQPFFVKVLAYNGETTPAVSKNFSDALAIPIVLSAQTAAGGDTAIPSGAIAWPKALPAPQLTFTAGVGIVAAPATNIPAFSFTDLYPKANLPTTIYVRASDANGVTSDRDAASVEAALTVVSGRLLVGNVYGSQNSPAPVDASAQYYMASGYVSNPQVALTSAAFGTVVTFSNCTRAYNVTGNGACPAGLRINDSNGTLTLTGGKGRFYIVPPKPAVSGQGTADVSLNGLIPYLPSTTGRATFGIYRSGPVIYTREVY